MGATSFDDIRAEFERRVSTIVWCTMTTNDRRGRLRSRIIHPLWEGSTGYLVTGRHSLKAEHLAANPFVSLTYWSPQEGLVVADCKATWDDDLAAKERAWKLFQATPPPYGYDPEMLGAKAIDPESGLLVLTPWRIELHSLGEVMQGKPALVWRP